MLPLKNTGITGGIKGINNAVPDVRVEVEKKSTPTPADLYGQTAKTGGNALQGELTKGAVQTQPAPTNLWSTSPSSMAKTMASQLDSLAKAAESGKGDLAKLATEYSKAFQGHDPAVRAGVDFLWSKEGTSTRAEMSAAGTRIAKAAPNLVFPGYIATEEKQAMAGENQQQLLNDALFRNSQPRNQWQPKATDAQLKAMTADQLRTFLSDDVVAARTRKAETNPLESAVAEAQMTGDPAAVRKAAQAIVALGDKGVADLGAMMEFYKSLA